MISLVVLGLAGVSGQAAAPAAAVEPPSLEAVGVQIGRLMANGEWRKAQAAFDRLSPEVRATPDVQFVLAFLARRLGQTDKAVDLYQRMLDGDASLLRVRLELADTFFEAGDDRAAEHNYRLALASEAAEQVRPRVEERLKQIAERRRWRYSFNVAVSPDSNVNTATAARETRIFGLPFELSDEARRTSGVSLSTAVSAERNLPLRGSTRLGFVGYGRFTDNERQVFDDGSIGARVGPQLWLGKVRVDAHGLWERRWFGGEPLSTTRGAEAEFQWGWGRVQRHAVLSARRLDYDVGDARDAWFYGVDWDRTRFLSATRFWRLSLGATRGDATDKAESFWLGHLSAGLYQTLPAGWAAWVEPSIERRAYDARGVLNASPRRDTELGLAVRIIKRDWRYRGFSPYVAAQKSRNASNSDLNDYTRLKVEFGATRTF